MSSNILRLNQVMDPQGNIGVVMLSTHKNVGATFTDTFTIENAGASYPLLAFPSVMPACDWAQITITPTGCLRHTAPGAIIPVPVSGIPAYPDPPPVGKVVSILPWSPSNTGVTVQPVSRMMGMLVPGTNPASIDPGVIDVLSLPGSVYAFDITVVPNADARGTKRWDFQLTSSGSPIATIAVAASLIDPDHGDSD